MDPLRRPQPSTCVCVVDPTAVWSGCSVEITPPHTQNPADLTPSAACFDGVVRRQTFNFYR